MSGPSGNQLILFPLHLESLRLRNIEILGINRISHSVLLVYRNLKWAVHALLTSSYITPCVWSHVSYM